MATQEQAAPPPALSTRSTGAAAGWDPYEVWRTRVLFPLLADKERNRSLSASPPVEALVLPLLVDERSQADHPRNDELEQELTIAVSYLLLAGLNGLFGSGAERGRHWPLQGLGPKHAPPSWRPVPRDGAGLRD